MTFRDRRDAGRQLAKQLKRFANRHDAVVLALPRGGVPVAFEVATALGLPLDTFAVRKLGVPGHEELAMGAIGSGGAYYINDEVVRSLRISAGDVRGVVAAELRELDRRERLYRDHRPRAEIAGNVAILVDDGVATGASMFAAIGALRRRDPARIVVAVPVAPADTLAALRGEVDELECCTVPAAFTAVGVWYDDFSQTSDEDVRALLDRAANASGS